MTIKELRHDARIRRAAIFNYATMHDSLSELEQELVGAEDIDRAFEAHDYALIALRAYRAEIDDPEPRS